MQSCRLPWGRMRKKKWIWMTKMMRTVLRKERFLNPGQKIAVYRLMAPRMQASRWWPA